MQHAIQQEYYDLALKELRRRRRMRWLRNAAVGLAAVFAIAFGVQVARERNALPAGKVVPVVRVGGEIGAAIDLQDLTARVEKAFEVARTSQTEKKVLILSIDSPGGDPTLAQRINARLRYLRSKNPDVRVVAACERMCASAAYMIAIQADEVVAGPYSLVGSIGAVITAFNVSEALAKLGVQYKAYGSGTSKAMLNPFIPATPGDEAKARQLVETLGALFVQEVRQRRKLDASVAIDSGEVWTAADALKLGLIDRVAVVEDVAFGDLAGAVPMIIENPKPYPLGPLVRSGLAPMLDWVLARLASAATDIAGRQ
ncbi:MAG: S49 family peptidase [Tepidimonas ignava]|uniref:S49 family peptidase n=1 Tax=Tepidimonas ignava TaxID=114249 RepID=UPI00391CFA65